MRRRSTETEEAEWRGAGAGVGELLEMRMAGGDEDPLEMTMAGDEDLLRMAMSRLGDRLETRMGFCCLEALSARAGHAG